MSFFQPGDIIIVWFPFEEDISKGKPRPAMVISIEDTNSYRVCQITKTNKTNKNRGQWIEKGTELYNSMGCDCECFINLDNIITVDKRLIRVGQAGVYPNVEDLFEKFNIE